GTARVLRGDYFGGIADANKAVGRANADPRTFYNAARVFALAASRVTAEAGREKGRQSRVLSSKYQDRALQLIREAIAREAPGKRESFWHDTIQNDPALKVLQPRLKFADLNATAKSANR